MKYFLLLLAGIGAVVLVLIILAQTPEQPRDTVVDDGVDVVMPSQEEAELVGFAFVQDVIKAAPSSDDDAAVTRIYEALSTRARAEVAVDTLTSDIALFMGIQDVPDQGASVEDLVIDSEAEATLIVGLNYSSGRALRAIRLVVEEGEWKVDEVTTLEQYPPDDTSSSPMPGDGSELPPGVTIGDGCYVGGCSSQVCSDDPDVITTCEWREEYACYRNATCERQADGECGWTQTDSLMECLASAADGSTY